MAEDAKKIAFVSGANRGLGFETSRELGEAGVHVIMGAREKESGEKAAGQLREKGLQVEAFKIDVTLPEDHLALFEYLDQKFRKLDILVNNAGVSLEGSVSDLGSHNTVLTVPVDTIKKTFDINFFSMLELTKILLPLLRNAQAARIVNVASILGSLTVHADPKTTSVSDHKSFAYGSSKTLINSFTIYLAHALRDTPIKVNSAHPGWVKTDLGGSGASLELSEGGKTSAQLALLDENGPTGGFFHLGEVVPW
jgi:NAD(P)-dependent dehydrogenase (short-subunit alcohol dehydrogenase family)